MTTLDMKNTKKLPTQIATARTKNLRLRRSVKTDVGTLIKLLDEYPEQTPIRQVINSLMTKLIKLESDKTTGETK